MLVELQQDEHLQRGHVEGAAPVEQLGVAQPGPLEPAGFGVAQTVQELT